MNVWRHTWKNVCFQYAGIILLYKEFLLQCQHHGIITSVVKTCISLSLQIVLLNKFTLDIYKASYISTCMIMPPTFNSELSFLNFLGGSAFFFFPGSASSSDISKAEFNRPSPVLSVCHTIKSLNNTYHAKTQHQTKPQNHITYLLIETGIQNNSKTSKSLFGLKVPILKYN